MANISVASSTSCIIIFVTHDIDFIFCTFSFPWMMFNMLKSQYASGLVK